jgi:hypothetical protein
MKSLFLPLLLLIFGFTEAQVQTPQPSPSAELTQTIGLTDFNVNYSRPSMRGRKIFGSLVPFEKLWRTGANKNTTISFNDDIVFGGQSVGAGEYAIFTKPGKKSWTIYLYKDTKNWGTPQEWDENLIVAETVVEVSPLENTVESFTIDFGHFTKNSAHLIMSWENTSTHTLIEVPTNKKVMASIKKAMNDPKPEDYYNAAVYYLETNKDINKAKSWIDTAMESRDDKPFWMLRQQSLIYAKAGKKAQAIKLAKLSLKGAEEAGNTDYIKINKASLKEWGAM